MIKKQPEKHSVYCQFVGNEEKKPGIIWRHVGKGFLIRRIYLPRGKNDMKARIKRDFPGVHLTERKISDGVAGIIARIWAGEKMDFDLGLLDWSFPKKFAAKVLREAHKIPVGKVIAYSELARRAGNPKAARAVGTVMARNPFPLVIPCHRVVRTDGSLGRFGGGTKMKKELLVREGVYVGGKGYIPEKYFWQ